MTSTYQLVIDAQYKGRGAFQTAITDVTKLNKATGGVGDGIKKSFAGLDSTFAGISGKMGGVASGFKGIGLAAGAAGLAVGAAAVAAKKAWDIMGEGAQLLRIEARFDKLAQSIGTTANVLTAQLRAATHGTISDMNLMASASQLISLRLADNADQVVRLGAVAGTLNWDMQQVILTFANMSTMRLDALGLSVSDVTSKARELELQGMSSQEAFKEAVILAGEAQKALLDVGNDTARQMEQSLASWENATNSFKTGLASVAGATGFTGLVSGLGDLFHDLSLSETERELKQIAGIIETLRTDTEIEINWGHVGRNTPGAIESANAVDGATENQRNQLVALNALQETYSDNAEVVALLRARIDELTTSIQAEAQAAALAAAGGRAIQDVYTEWATATKVQGEQAENFLKTFNEAIGGMSSANIDAGPLVTFGEALNSTAENAGAMQFSVESANQALYEAAAAAGASASELALLGVATGQFTEAEADAALKTAILQEAINRLASDYANGTISVYEMSNALREQMSIIANMPSMFDAAERSARQASVLLGSSGQGDGPAWYRPVGPVIRRDAEEVEKATRAVGGFSRAVDHLGEAQKRISSAFSAEIGARVEDGLIDAAGVVNMEAANKALYEQAQAAGATASQLALLGVATGQFTEEQAQAALKAAILQEKIKQIAAGVASGELSYGDAAGGLASFSEQLNSGALASAAGGIEGVAAAADEFANSTYEAELTVENRAAMDAIQEAILALGQLTGTHYINLVTTTTGAPPTTTNGSGGGGGTPSTPDDRRRSNVVNGQSGGASYNVSVVNYVNGSQQSRSTLDDVTTDKIKAALGALGVRS